MTRSEKQTVKKEARSSARNGYICIAVGMFAFGYMIVCLFTNQKELFAYISMGIFFTSLLLGTIFGVKNQTLLNKLLKYKKDLIWKRNVILTSIAIDAVKAKNVEKAINIHKILTLSEYKIFLKGYLISKFENSDNKELEDMAKLNISEVLEK